jgi:hypothetical protein
MDGQPGQEDGEGAGPDRDPGPPSPGPGPGPGGPGADDDELAGLLRAWAALESWAAAAKLGMVREMMRREGLPSPGSDHGDLPETWSASLPYELAGALACSTQSAESTACLAWELQARLPGIGARLDDGTLTQPKARAITETFGQLMDADAAAAEARAGNGARPDPDPDPDGDGGGQTQANPDRANPGPGESSAVPRIPQIRARTEAASGRTPTTARAPSATAAAWSATTTWTSTTTSTTSIATTNPMTTNPTAVTAASTITAAPAPAPGPLRRRRGRTASGGPPTWSCR